ncbi:MAG: phosphopantetheine-binding protein [Terriglobales bacterium]
MTDDLALLLRSIRPGLDNPDVEDFFARGVLDSLGLITLVSSLEERYGVFIDVADIVPENFRNLAAIRALLARSDVRSAGTGA